MSINIVDTGLKFTSTLTKRAKTTAIVLHHAAGTGSVMQIHQEHLNKGWAGIGYNFYVRLDGSIYKGRGWEYIGAHAGASSGYNGKSIGICFEGDYTQLTKMPVVQYNAGVALIKEALNKYGSLEIVGHKDVYATACPGTHFPLDEMKAITDISTGKEESTVAEKDNTPDGYAKEAVEWAVDNEVLRGNTEGNYMLHSPVTRQDLLVILYKFSRLSK